MRPVVKGMAAGFVATAVLSVLMLLKAAAGVMPELNAIDMLARIADDLVGAPPLPITGWVTHFLIGTVFWGGLFAVVWPRWPGNGAAVQGIIFSTMPWLAMMTAAMPMDGAGLFGTNIGPGAPALTLFLHVVFGAVLGAVFGELIRSGRKVRIVEVACFRSNPP